VDLAAPSLAGMKWVATFRDRAVSMTARASSRRFASGLWTITFMPFFRAASAMVAWV
jgi:hypothetical protein